MRNELIPSPDIEPARAPRAPHIAYKLNRFLIGGAAPIGVLAICGLVLLTLSMGSSDAFAQDSEALKTAIAQRDQKILELEKKNADLMKQAADLNQQLDGVQRKFAAADGDRQFLLKELKTLQQRMQAGFDELTKILNTLADLPDPAICKALSNSLKHTQQAPARVAILESLNRVPIFEAPPELKDQLETLRRDPSPRVRAAADAVLKRVK